MPRYGYECEQCGPFEAFRPMAAFDAPHVCPRCDEPAPRSLAAPSPSTMDAGRRLASATNEKSAHEPAIRATHTHSANCGCGKSTRAAREKAFPDRRPWMISH